VERSAMASSGVNVLTPLNDLPVPLVHATPRGSLFRYPVLAASLIDTTTGKATGVVVGITGPWGSGKSSILYLLQAELEHPENRTAYHHAVIVRFDPWLVSGRDDLIVEFLRELQATLREVGTRYPQVATQLKKLAGKLAEYGSRLAPFAALASAQPAAGGPAAAGL